MTKRLLFTWSALAVCVLLSACESGDSIRIVSRAGAPGYSSGGTGGGGGGAGGAGGSAPSLDPLTGDPTPRTDGCPADAPLAPNRVRIWPAKGQAAMLVGARIQGSNSGPTTDFVDLATVSSAPTEGKFTIIDFVNTQKFRYLRYYAAAGSQGGLVELEFYFGTTRITGKAFGTAVDDSMYTWALDGNASTAFAPTTAGGGYVGIDISGSSVTKRVTFTPANTSSQTPIDLTLASATTNAKIRYTINGQEPTSAIGTPYMSPIHLDNGTWQIRAISYADCLFDSPLSTVTYIVDPNAKPVTPGLKSYHLGNSLTDTINHWLKPIADSTGVNHTYARWTIPGTTIAYLYEHQGDGFGDPEGATLFDTFVQNFAPIDHLSIQPYADPDWDTQGAAALSVLNKALEYSPNIQFWIYAQWPALNEWQPDAPINKDAFANGGGKVFPPWQVQKAPTTWEEAVQNQVLYHEAFRAQIQPMVEGKPILIVPGGLALVELKRQFEAGMIPGQSGDFFKTFFEDEVHVMPQAQYLVSLVFYACLYKQTPESRVTHEGTGLTVEQALIYQRIAWTIASSYPNSGIQP